MDKSNFCAVLGITLDDKYFVVYNEKGQGSVTFEEVEKEEIGYIASIYTRYSEYTLKLIEISKEALISFRNSSLRFLETLRDDLYVYDGGGVDYIEEAIDSRYSIVDLVMRGYSESLSEMKAHNYDRDLLQKTKGDPGDWDEEVSNYVLSHENEVPVKCVISLDAIYPSNNIIQYARETNIQIYWDDLVPDRDCGSCVHNKNGLCCNKYAARSGNFISFYNLPTKDLSESGRSKECIGYDVDTNTENRLLKDGLIAK